MQPHCMYTYMCVQCVGTTAGQIAKYLQMAGEGALVGCVPSATGSLAIYH